MPAPTITAMDGHRLRGCIGIRGNKRLECTCGWAVDLHNIPGALTTLLEGHLATHGGRSASAASSLASIGSTA